jgi:hypothetical protein
MTGQLNYMKIRSPKKNDPSIAVAATRLFPPYAMTHAMRTGKWCSAKSLSVNGSDP